MDQLRIRRAYLPRFTGRLSGTFLDSVHNEIVLIDCAAYRDGERMELECTPEALGHALETFTDDNDFVWIGLFRPDAAELGPIATAFKLHPLAVEDAIESHQRPKIDAYSDHLFVSLKTVEYGSDSVELSEINAFLGDHYLITIRHSDHHDLGSIRKRTERHREVLGGGPTAALHAVIDSVADQYEKVAAEFDTDVEEIEEVVFSADNNPRSARVYRLKRETIEFRRAVYPLHDPVEKFARLGRPEVVRPFYRDIADHLARVKESIDAIDSRLDNALNAHLAQLSVQQNDDMRKLAAGATLFAVPTMLAGIYGMNFTHMPELDWTYGYPGVLLVMVSLCVYIYSRFKRSGWL